MQNIMQKICKICHHDVNNLKISGNVPNITSLRNMQNMQLENIY